MSAALTVSLDESTLTAFDRLYGNTERSRDWLVANAVEDYVASHSWRMGKIESGLAAADRGDFAADEDVARCGRSSRRRHQAAVNGVR